MLITRLFVTIGLYRAAVTNTNATHWFAHHKYTLSYLTHVRQYLLDNCGKCVKWKIISTALVHTPASTLPYFLRFFANVHGGIAAAAAAAAMPPPPLPPPPPFAVTYLHIHRSRKLHCCIITAVVVQV